jgi:hypothetical protein
MNRLSLIFAILVFLLNAGLTQTVDPVFSWIENGYEDRIEEYLLDHDINKQYDESGTTLLIYSIIHGETRTTALLIKKGANVNLAVEGVSPLMYASSNGEPKEVSDLIDAGANMEARDSEGNTALFYAASNGNLRNSQVLLRKGANILHANYLHQSAYDQAVWNSKSEVAKYLRQEYLKNLPDLRDGPYIKWNRRKKITAFYMVHDSKSQMTRRKKIGSKPDSSPFLLKGFAGDTLEYLVDKRRDVPGDSFDNVDRVIVIGDIHGGYDSLVIFLQHNGVINGSLQWTWGEGHLAFVGDIFDRGEKVTEALWLVYQLEKQAAKAGGAVHMVLGNHEIMVLTGDLSYVADKYRLMFSRLHIDYSSLFGKRTVLGQWLRTKNTIVKINGHLFVHAGLSPSIPESGLDMHQINQNVRYFLNHPEKDQNGDVEKSTLLGTNGPFWYRGYLEHNHAYQHLPEDEFGKVLKYFDADYIFIGHTNVKEITPLYSNRVYAIDVPFYSNGYSIFGLLIEDRDVYILNSSAEKKQIR